MTPERLQQIESLYHAALECPTANRAAFLSGACANDEELLRKVTELLNAREQKDSFIEQPIFHQGLALMAEKHPSLVGQEIGPYKIFSLIGEGGMGEVYDALDTRLGRRVAFKVLLPALAGNADHVRHFQREARAAAAIAHPNVAQVYEAGEANGLYFIAMEYVEGTTLRRHLLAGARPQLESLEIVCQVAAALAAAHEVGIAHRDIKPENVMLLSEGHVKVLDFGLAKRIESPSVKQGRQAFEMSTRFKTLPGVILGTLPYMSPEQARGQTVDARSDLWSLGVMLFEMITGRLPFTGDTPSDIIAAILEHNPPSLNVFLPDASGQLYKIVAKALAKDPDRRYQTARELHADLKYLKEKTALDELRQASLPRRIIRMARRVRAFILRFVISFFGWFHGGRAAVASLSLVALLVVNSIFWQKFFSVPEGSGKVEEAPFTRIEEKDFLENGNVLEAIVSPDKKFVAYVTEGSDHQSLGLKWVETSEEQSLPQNEPGSYNRLAVSRDGNSLYYTLFRQSAEGELHRTSIRGDLASQKLLNNIDTPVTFSPDGQRIAFVRRKQLEPPELIVANANGDNEQVLASDQRLTPGGVAWSPHGQAIACTIQPEGDEKHQTIIEVSLKNLNWTPLTAYRWDKIERLAWLENGRGLVAVAADKSPLAQLWYIPNPPGNARRITTGVDEYRSLSLSSDSQTIATVRSRRQARIRVASISKAEDNAKELMIGKNVGTDGLAWTPDGRIIYTSTARGNRHLWIMNVNGKEQRQLTSDGGTARHPAVSPDNKYVIFVSDQSGTSGIWRLNLDGPSNPTKLTNGADDIFPTVSPDSRWVIYAAQTDSGRNLWKVPIEGGKPEQLTSYLSNWPSVSPDGNYIFCMYRAPSENASIELAVIPFSGGNPVIKFPLPSGIAVPPDMVSPGFHWNSDSRSVFYVNTDKGVSNLWQQPIAGGSPKRITDFTSDRIFWFDVSRKNGQLAYSRGQYLRDGVLITDLSHNPK